MGFTSKLREGRSWHAAIYCNLNLTFISYSFWNTSLNCKNVQHVKKIPTVENVQQLSELQINCVFAFFEFLKHKTKSIKILQIWWKKGNNSKMGIQIYFKIAG
jgi:hypothetical protein